jgi:hypothetical protein
MGQSWTAATRFPIFRIFFGAFAQVADVASLALARLSVSAHCKNSRITEQIFMKFDIGGILPEFCRHVPFPMNRTVTTLYEHVNAFLHRSASLLALHMVFISTAMFRTKDAEKTKHSFHAHCTLSVSHNRSRDNSRAMTHRWQRLHGAFEKSTLDSAQHKPLP